MAIIIKKTKTTKAGHHTGKKKCLYTVGGNVN
jgi:hypothetical protein